MDRRGEAKDEIRWSAACRTGRSFSGSAGGVRRAEGELLHDPSAGLDRMIYSRVEI